MTAGSLDEPGARGKRNHRLAKATTRERVPIPAPLGWVCVVGGILMIVGGTVGIPALTRKGNP